MRIQLEESFVNTVICLRRPSFLLRQIVPVLVQLAQRPTHIERTREHDRL